ncbi:VOC family protein [Salegentibacter sp. F14]
MLEYSAVFSGFSVRDLEKAKLFYSRVLGFSVYTNPMGVLELEIPGHNSIIIYPKTDHQPAVFTVLNIPVKNIDGAVAILREKAVEFEQYQGEISTDKIGIHRSKEGGPKIAWFKDPDGNILSLIEK